LPRQEDRVLREIHQASAARWSARQAASASGATRSWRVRSRQSFAYYLVRAFTSPSLIPRRTAVAHFPTILDDPKGHAAAPRARSGYGILAAATAAAVVASLVTATVLNRSPAAAVERHAALPPAAPAPAAPATVDASPGTSVPEASTIFNGKDKAVEEAAPSF
jgi:hypothetical protein